MFTVSQHHSIALRQRGFTLLEVLIAAFLLSIGLLGLASVQTMGLRYNQIAYHRTQATLLSYDMVDRMRANVVGVRQGKYDLIVTDSPPDEPKCLAVSCSAADIAIADIRQWSLQMQSVLPQGSGSVNKDAVGTFIIHVMWDDREPTSGTPCDPNRPRLQCVSLTVRL